MQSSNIVLIDNRVARPGQQHWYSAKQCQTVILSYSPKGSAGHRPGRLGPGYTPASRLLLAPGTHYSLSLLSHSISSSFSSRSSSSQSMSSSVTVVVGQIEVDHHLRRGRSCLVIVLRLLLLYVPLPVPLLLVLGIFWMLPCEPRSPRQLCCSSASASSSESQW